MCSGVFHTLTSAHFPLVWDTPIIRPVCRCVVSRDLVSLTPYTLFLGLLCDRLCWYIKRHGGRGRDHSWTHTQNGAHHLSKPGFCGICPRVASSLTMYAFVCTLCMMPQFGKSKTQKTGLVRGRACSESHTKSGVPSASKPGLCGVIERCLVSLVPDTLCLHPLHDAPFWVLKTLRWSR